MSARFPKEELIYVNLGLAGRGKFEAEWLMNIFKGTAGTSPVIQSISKPRIMMALQARLDRSCIEAKSLTNGYTHGVSV